MLAIYQVLKSLRLQLGLRKQLPLLSYHLWLDCKELDLEHVEADHRLTVDA